MRHTNASSSFRGDVRSQDFGKLEPSSYRTPADFYLPFRFQFCASCPTPKLTIRHHPLFPMSALISHPHHARNLAGSWNVRETPVQISNNLFLKKVSAVEKNTLLFASCRPLKMSRGYDMV